MPDKAVVVTDFHALFPSRFPGRAYKCLFLLGLSVSKVSGNSGFFALWQDGQREKRSQLGGERFTFASPRRYSLQPRLAEGGRMTLQHYGIFDGDALPVYLQGELWVEPQHFSSLGPRLGGSA